MERARFKKALSIACGGALMLGIMGTGASAGASSSAKIHFTTTGSADAAIDVNGAFSVTVDGTDAATGVASTTTVTGQLKENSGIGVKNMTSKTKTDKTGAFSHEIVSPRDAASGLATGRLYKPDGTPDGTPIPAAGIKITIKCTISYPPLRAGCTIIISA